MTRITQGRVCNADTLTMDKQIRNERTANTAMAAQTGRPALTAAQLEIIRRLGA